MEGQICSMHEWGNAIMETIKRGFKKVANDTDTLFWWEVWTGNECLKNKFPRLFVVSMQKK